MSAMQEPIAPYLLRRALAKPATLTTTPPLPEPRASLLSDLMGILQARWRLIATTVAIGVGLTAAYCFLATPWYLGQANVLIEVRGAPQVLNSERFGEVADAFVSQKYDYYQTQYALLVSPSLVKRVIDELNLTEEPHFLAGAPGVAAAKQAGGDVIQAAIRQYLKLLEIVPVRGTRLVTVLFYSTDAKLAANIANTHSRLFIRGGLERTYGGLDQMRTFLETKLGELAKARDDAETKLVHYQNEHHLLPVDLNRDVANERLTELNRRLTMAEADKITLEAQFQLVQKHDYDSLPAVISSPLIGRLRDDVNHLEIERALMAQKFRPSYPKMQELDGQFSHAQGLLQKETRKVVESVEVSYLQAQKTVEQLTNGLEAQRALLLSRKDTEGEFLALNRDVETTRSLYDNLLSRVKDLNIAAGAQTSNINIAEPAVPPLMPSYPTTKLFLVVSMLATLLLGSGLAIARHNLDRTIRDVEDVRRATGLNTLAIIPDLDARTPGSHVDWLRWRAQEAGRLASKGLRRLTGTNGHSHSTTLSTPPILLGNGHELPLAEAYRTLRTSLLLSGPMAAPRVLLIASSAGSEGKTTTAVNTALSLANCGAKVLLIDGDLRLPRCHDALGILNSTGLSEYLAAAEEGREPIVETEAPNLWFVPAGQVGTSPTELLTSWRLCKFLREVRERFDFIVIDSPPLLVVSDALLLANLADGVILVSESGRTREDHVRVAMQRLVETGSAPLGVVLNRGRIDRSYYRYSYRYAEAFRDGHARRAASGANTDTVVDTENS